MASPAASAAVPRASVSPVRRQTASPFALSDSIDFRASGNRPSVLEISYARPPTANPMSELPPARSQRPKRTDVPFDVPSTPLPETSLTFETSAGAVVARASMIVPDSACSTVRMQPARWTIGSAIMCVGAAPMRQRSPVRHLSGHGSNCQRSFFNPHGGALPGGRTVRGRHGQPENSAPGRRNRRSRCNEPRTVKAEGKAAAFGDMSGATEGRLRDPGLDRIVGSENGERYCIFGAALNNVSSRFRVPPQGATCPV